MAETPSGDPDFDRFVFAVTSGQLHRSLKRHLLELRARAPQGGLLRRLLGVLTLVVNGKPQEALAEIDGLARSEMATMEAAKRDSWPLMTPSIPLIWLNFVYNRMRGDVDVRFHLRRLYGASAGVAFSIATMIRYYAARENIPEYQSRPYEIVRFILEKVLLLPAHPDLP